LFKKNAEVEVKEAEEQPALVFVLHLHGFLYILFLPYNVPAYE
jgi:hypothetical protein